MRLSTIVHVFVISFSYGNKSNKLMFLQANCEDPDQTPLIVASALGLLYYVQKLNSRLIFVRYVLNFLQAKYGNPDQALLTVASTLGLQYLPMSKTKIGLWAYIG